MEGGEYIKSMKPIYVIILVVVFAAAGFYGGTVYQKSQAQNSAGAGGQYGSRRFGAGAGGGAGASGMTPVSGKIVSTGSGSITVQLSDGSSKIIDLTGQTAINKSTKGSTSDLTTGTRVTALGTTNSDGSVTAQMVNIGNGMFRMRPQGGGSQTAQPSGSQ